MQPGGSHPFYFYIDFYYNGVLQGDNPAYTVPNSAFTVNAYPPTWNMFQYPNK